MKVFLNVFFVAAFAAPTLLADSIPVTSTHALTIADLRTANQACLLTFAGDMKLPTKVNVSFPQSYHRFFVDTENHVFQAYNSRSPGDQFSMEQDIIYPSNTDLTQGVGGKYFEKVAEGYFRLKGFHVNFCNDCVAGTPDRLWLVIAGGLPYYTYKWQPSDLGETTGDRRLVTNLEVQLPLAHSASVPFVNVTTGLETTHTVNLQQYADCLVKSAE